MILVNDSTVQFTATFDEPTKNADNTSLADLKNHTVWVKVGVQPAASVATVAASGLSGGQKISTTILVPASINQITTFDAWVTSSDLTGNTSLPSTHVTVTVDRIGPLAPTNFLLA